ncbi:MAG: rod shape-determining protein MreC [Lachnospiraceae bacterium]|nr:rod shape-determining protein MreC [Lachnospiraceae bacterium]
MSPLVKKPDEKYKLPTKYWLMILTGICIILMLFTFVFDLPLKPFNEIVSFTVVPLQKGISIVGEKLYSKKELMNQVNDLVDKNNKLMKQVDDLTYENNILMQDKYELNSLRKLYELDQTYSDYPKTGARVISGSTGNWFSTFIIDKGSNDGMKVGMNVLAGGGLVGRITEVGSNWSRVLSIIDDTSNVSCMVLTTNDHLMVSGSLSTMESGFINFNQLSDNATDVEVGDKVVTSNISDVYLPGIQVGNISYMEKDSNHLSISGYITPSVNFEHISEVLVITKLKTEIN